MCLWLYNGHVLLGFVGLLIKVDQAMWLLLVLTYEQQVLLHIHITIKVFSLQHN